jgi:hypothetical protein
MTDQDGSGHLLRRKDYEEFFRTELGISPTTLQRWIRARIIPSIKIRGIVFVDPDKALAALRRFERSSLD